MDPSRGVLYYESKPDLPSEMSVMLSLLDLVSCKRWITFLLEYWGTKMTTPLPHQVQGDLNDYSMNSCTQSPRGHHNNITSESKYLGTRIWMSSFFALIVAMKV